MKRRQFLHRLSRSAVGLGAGVSAALLPELVSADPLPPELALTWPKGQLAGGGELRYLGLHIYDSRLWIPVGVNAQKLPQEWASLPLALEIEYARRFEGKDIAKRSLKEMKRIASISDEAAQRWLSLMSRVFPDVDRGDRITGLHIPGERARFFHNGQPTGDIQDAEFARLFFGIWLSPRTSEPGLRAALMGMGPTR